MLIGANQDSIALFSFELQNLRVIFRLSDNIEYSESEGREHPQI